MRSLCAMRKMGPGKFHWMSKAHFSAPTTLLSKGIAYRISSAPEVFQKGNEQLFGYVEGVHVVFDDLIIGGKDDAEHDGILKQVLDRARTNNVKFTPDKFHFRVTEVKNVGQVVSSEG